MDLLPGSLGGPRASISSRSGNRQASSSAQRPAYKGLGSWGQQLHVVPLGEHCGSGKGAGVQAEGRGAEGRGVESQEPFLSWTPRTGCSGRAGRGREQQHWAEV